MADETPKPMTDKDFAPASAHAFAPDEPAKDTGRAADASTVSSDIPGSDEADGAGARQTISENVTKLKGDAADRVLSLADQGKARASGALGELSQMLTDAAAQVDDKLGAQYGQYARSAAERVQGFSSSLNDKSVDDLLDDARTLVRKSPAVAIGVAAAAGFAFARLLSAGFDQREKA
jgi:ElaB/YqjD/DUF883 family membrane-anchored ribosome-binding protein